LHRPEQQKGGIFFSKKENKSMLEICSLASIPMIARYLVCLAKV